MEEGQSAGLILLADDDVPFGTTLERFLRHHGYECVRASDAAGAMQALGDRDFDLLISDIHMPGNDGMALLHHVRVAAPDLPAILMTGYPTMDTAIRSVGLSVVGYLVKPPDPPELLALIRREIGTRRRVRALRQRDLRLRECVGELRAMRTTTEGDSNDADRLIERLEEALKMGGEGGLEGTAVRRASEGVSGAALEPVLREIIAALDATRRYFKSRELGQLRRRLEVLIEAGRTGPEGPGPPRTAEDP